MTLYAKAYNENPRRGPYFSIPSSPGRVVAFHGNVARLTSDADIHACALDAAIVIEVERDWSEYVHAVYDPLGTRAQARLVEPHTPLEPAVAEADPGALTMPNGHKLDCECVFCERIRRSWKDVSEQVIAPAGA